MFRGDIAGEGPSPSDWRSEEERAAWKGMAAVGLLVGDVAGEGESQVAGVVVAVGSIVEGEGRIARLWATL